MSKSIKHRYLFIPDKIQRSQAKLNTINQKKYKGQNEYQRANNPKVRGSNPLPLPGKLKGSQAIRL